MEGLAVPFNAVAEGLDSVYQRLLDVKDGIVNKLGEVKDFIVSIPDTLVDIGTSLWIPDEDFFTELYGGIYDDLKEKIPIVDQVEGIAMSFYDVISNADDTPPTFDITYKGQTMSIIDLSMYAEYRSFIHAIILCIAYYLFAIKIIKRLPTFLGGFSSDN